MQLGWVIFRKATREKIQGLDHQLELLSGLKPLSANFILYSCWKTLIYLKFGNQKVQITGQKPINFVIANILLLVFYMDKNNYVYKCFTFSFQFSFACF